MLCLVSERRKRFVENVLLYGDAAFDAALACFSRLKLQRLLYR